MKEAFAQLSAEGFNNCDEEQTVRMMLHHAFNDHYHRTGNPGPLVPILSHNCEDLVSMVRLVTRLREVCHGS